LLSANVIVAPNELDDGERDHGWSADAAKQHNIDSSTAPVASEVATLLRASRSPHMLAPLGRIARGVTRQKCGRARELLGSIVICRFLRHAMRNYRIVE
jgi:hypothetical protein